MHILLTGYAGYVGSVMSRLLAATAHIVVGLDTGFFADCTFAGTARPADPKAISKDLRDLVPADLAGFDAVIHLAGLSNDPLGDLAPELTAAINHQATLRLAELAKEAGVGRFLQASSCSIYGAAGEDVLDETARFNPVTPYGVSKVLSEQDLSALADDHFSPTFLRSATAYGVSPRLRLDVVLNNLVGVAVVSGKVVLLSDGTPWRPLVHVEDMCRAFLAALEAPRDRVHDQAFNVGRDEENYRILELAEIVAATVPGSSVEIAEGAGPDTRTYRVDFGKIARELPGFTPRWDARRGARELHEAFVRAGFDRGDFDGPRFKRLAQIKHLLTEGQLGADLRWRTASA